MKWFEMDLAKFMEEYALPPLTKRPNGWTRFLHAYAQVFEDIPLVVLAPSRKKSAQKSRQSKSDNAPKHISHVEVHFDEVPIDWDAGKTEILFRVTWTIHDKNGKSGDIFVLNSFARET